MSKRKIFSFYYFFVVLLIFIICGASGAMAQGQPPVVPAKKYSSKREYLNDKEAHGGAAQPRLQHFPNMSRDFLTALETLGIRPGMSLAEANSIVASWGAYLGKEDQRNLSITAKPSPSNPYNQAHINGAFFYTARPKPDYRGHPFRYNLNKPDDIGHPAGVSVSVYPVNPLGDLEDPHNLVVYQVRGAVDFMPLTGTQGVMPVATFLDGGASRIGHALSDTRSGPRSGCGFAVQDYSKRVVSLAEVLKPRMPPYIEQWKACGIISLVEYAERQGYISEYRITHTDVTHAERAFNAFRVYGSELREAILRDQQ